MTVLVEPDSSQRELLRSALAGPTTLATIQELDAHARSTSVDLAAVIGPSVPLEDASRFAGWARIHRPALGVILLRHRVDSTVLGEALRSGMREVVEARDLTGAAQAVQRAHIVAEAMLTSQGRSMTEPGARGRLVTVFSTKGGVGKSVVATNLATALADQGRRVCLVDLDVHCGDVAILLQLTPTRQLNHLTAFAGVIDREAAASVLTEHSPGLSVVAAPVHLDAPDQATADDVAGLLDQLKTMFDVVVVDTAGTFDDHALVALDRSETLVLVGTLDIPALKSLKLAVGTLDLLNLPRERWRLVINRADAKVGLTTKDYEETLGLSADCVVSSSRDVLMAVNRGEPLVRSHPSHPNSKSLTAFARTLATSAASPATVPETAVPDPVAAGGRAAGGGRRAVTGRRRRLRKVT